MHEQAGGAHSVSACVAVYSARANCSSMSTSSGMDWTTTSERGYMQHVSMKPWWITSRHTDTQISYSIHNGNGTGSAHAGGRCQQDREVRGVYTKNALQPTCSATESSIVEPVVSTSPDTSLAAQACNPHT